MVSAVAVPSTIPDASWAQRARRDPASWSRASLAPQAADQPSGAGCTAGPAELPREGQDTEAEGQLARRDHVEVRAQRGDDYDPRGALAPLVGHGGVAELE